MDLNFANMSRVHRRGRTRFFVLFALFPMAASALWFIPRTDAQGSDEIPFRKHTIDLGPSETVAIVDLNRDGKLDIVSGENWFEQAPPAAPGEGPRWIKHKIGRASCRERVSSVV